MSMMALPVESQAPPVPQAPRFDLRAAFGAMRALLDDPDDTSQVFVIIKALSGNAIERNYRKFRKTEFGNRVLRERRNLLAVLQDRAALDALPEASLGRAYLNFLAEEGITAEGLVSASEPSESDPSFGPDLRLFRERMRDMHDLWHVVAGYQGDIIGEAALLAFSFAQTWSPGLGFIALIATVKIREVRGDVTGLVARAFGRGLVASWLPGRDWETLLALPLEQVRRDLHLDSPPRYVPLRTNAYITRFGS
jgi:ubiquinone biosynthesis protein COQ4